MAESTNPWRLKYMLIIFVVLTLMYAVQGVFVVAQEEMRITDLSQTGNISSEDLANATARSSGENFIGVLGWFLGFITFQAIEGIPLWASGILSMFTSVCTIVISYIIYTFIRDWIPFVG